MCFPGSVRWLLAPVASLLLVAAASAQQVDNAFLFAGAECPEDEGVVEPQAVHCATLDAGVLKNMLDRPTDLLPMRLNLFPVDDRIVTAIVVHYESTGRDAYSVTANIEDVEYGSAVLAIQGSSVAGTVHLEHRVFEISPLATDVEVIGIREVDVDALPMESPPGELNLEGIEPGRFPIEPEDEEIPPAFDRPLALGHDEAMVFAFEMYRPIRAIKILALFPRDNFQALCGRSFFGFFGRRIAALRRALMASLLTQTTSNIFYPIARAEVVVECVDYKATGETLRIDMNWLRTGHAKTVAQLHAMNLPMTGLVNEDVFRLRLRHEADIVNLIVPMIDNDGNPNNNSCGYSIHPKYPDFKIPNYMDIYANNGMFGVTMSTCIFSRFSFAHEVGHNIGMQHDRTVAGINSPAECGYGYIIRDQYNAPLGTTVLAYPSVCESVGGTDLTCRRKPFLSVPAGEPYFHHHVAGAFPPPLEPVVAGIACGGGTRVPATGSAHNAKRLAETAAYVALYDTLIDRTEARLPNQ